MNGISFFSRFNEIASSAKPEAEKKLEAILAFRDLVLAEFAEASHSRGEECPLRYATLELAKMRIKGLVSEEEIQTIVNAPKVTKG